MFQSRIQVSRACLWLCALLLPLSFVWGGTFSVIIKPTNSGTVTWHTEDHARVLPQFRRQHSNHCFG